MILEQADLLGIVEKGGDTHTCLDRRRSLSMNLVCVFDDPIDQPGAETTVEVVVQPVPGEQVSDNNSATYTVVFG